MKTEQNFNAEFENFFALSKHNIITFISLFLKALYFSQTTIHIDFNVAWCVGENP